jgi:hypothetical protein
MAADLKVLLPAGDHQAGLLDSLVLPPKATYYLGKIEKSLGALAQYTLPLMLKSEGQPMAYDSILGITEPEYKEFLTLIAQKELVPSSYHPMKISWAANEITFAGTNVIEAFANLNINLADSIITLGDEYEMVYQGPLLVTTDQNGMKSKMDGHVWALEINDIVANATDPTKPIPVYFMLKLTVARLQKNGQTLIRLEAKALEGNEVILNEDFPITF